MRSKIFYNDITIIGALKQNTHILHLLEEEVSNAMKVIKRHGSRDNDKWR